MVYRFRTMLAADLSQIWEWLRLPHVRQWWGDPDDQYALIRGDLDEPAMDQYVFDIAGTPAGYLQCYSLTEWNAGFGIQPEGTRGIDVFIGHPGLHGAGHGPRLLRHFSDQTFAHGIPRVVTDPDPANVRAIRAYEKAGFLSERLVATPDGPALLMMRQADDLLRPQSRPS